MRRPDAAAPIVLIAAGVILLAWNLDWFPDLRTIAGWILIAAGVALLAIDGITRKSVVAGPALIIAGLLWFAHLEWRTPLKILVPLGMIVLGCLMLIARLPAIPESRASGRADTPPAPGDGPGSPPALR